ncbi:hypothetical protein MAPG_10816 [Magnaporthiopsis poae ATCC 64411]|uniref:Uncharacterized protein n=1 Tax=Magnaporthiopsis poae (strain ATCC 64411 / 73-15) TaxID=644358 RepID=A0A0C4EDL2_MAGP6|nr:hypothetical protein MAPG_10816 [Magnaporthiopsis poae ATCC 64411]
MWENLYDLMSRFKGGRLPPQLGTDSVRRTRTWRRHGQVKSPVLAHWPNKVRNRTFLNPAGGEEEEEYI